MKKLTNGFPKNAAEKTRHLKLFACLGLSLIYSTSIFAQTSSYVANTIPVGGVDNAAFGFNALLGGSGQGNVAIGKSTLSAGNYGQYNVAIGPHALKINTSGYYNIAVGSAALANNTSGYFNAACGVHALLWNSTGARNASTGYRSLFYNTTGSENVAMGTEALVNNVTGDNNCAFGTRALYNNDAHGNTALGNEAMFINTVGTENVAVGNYALHENLDGYNNTAVGVTALRENIDGMYNTGLGFEALLVNKSGYNNTAVGSWALNSNLANFNAAVGNSALQFNSYGVGNSGLGQSALNVNSMGDYNAGVGFFAGANVQGNKNTAMGAHALIGLVTGDGNTGVGYNATVSNGLSNATAIGNGAVSNASNRMMLGNAALVGIWSVAQWIANSDQRFKTNVKSEDVKGLEFIKLLRPVVYNFEAKKLEEFMTKDMPDSLREKYLQADFDQKTSLRQSGFLAQEVELAAKKSGYDFSGVFVPKHDKETYGLAYSEFVVPLVKGMQEQQKMIEDQAKEIADLKNQMNAQNKTGNATGISQLNSVADGFALEQNIPNPFSSETVINYTLPQQIKNASLIVYDLSGKQLTSFPLELNAKSISITSEKLSAGIYIYSVMADGKIMDSKRMVVADKQ